MKFLLLAFLMAISGCNGSKEDTFEGLDDSSGEDAGPVVLNVSIDSYTPTQSLTILTQESSAVFAATVNVGSGAVVYDFSMDGGPSLQSVNNSFYVLAGSSITSGNHTLKVTATNQNNSDSHEFNIRKNSPSQIVTHAPALSGATINCGLSDLTFSGVILDTDNDPFTISWEIDSVPVTVSTPFASITTVSPFSQLNYNPDCTQAGSHTITLKIYDGYEVTSKIWNFNVNNPPTPPGSVAITAFTPTINPVVLTQSGSATFAVTVNDGVGAVSYDFIQDNLITLQSGSSSFYNLAGSTLTSGYHSLKVVASNGTSSAERIFNIRKNTAPAILGFTPAVNGESTNCTSGSITFNSTHTDNDGDPLTVSWALDNTQVTGLTPFTSISNGANTAQLTYSPDCTKVGSHNLILTISDGHETTTKAWTFSINSAPALPGNVQILTFTPNIDPVVMTSTSTETFAVSIADGAGAVTYEFMRDYTTVLQNNATPFFILSGSSLSPGLHTLKVRGTNSVSFNEKVFNIRKNTPTTILASSPATNGSIINCGQDSIAFNTVMIDNDSDIFTRTWELDSTPVTGATEFISISNSSSSTQMLYTPDCTRSGVHTVSLKLFDGYETTTQNWSFSVINPAIESIVNYFPSQDNITYLSTDTLNSFNVTGTGVGSLTFAWKLNGLTVKTETGAVSSSYPLPATDLTIGNHVLEVTLSDSVSTNNPAIPVTRTWNIYKNMKPRFVTFSPSAPRLTNLNNSISISASIEDVSDTFTTTFSKGATPCIPNGLFLSAACGLTGVNLPTTTGVFSSIFNPGSTFLGENLFLVTVTDSRGESVSQSFTITANYFSDACNNLGSGQICTLAGLPGLGSGISMVTDANKVRVTPAWMAKDDVGNLFFSDHATNTVWYYNSQSFSVSVFGVTVPAFTLQHIAGTGIAGAGGNGVFARSFALNFGNQGGGMAWDSRDQSLYVSDYTNNRVIRINSSGRANIVCGAGALNTQGANAVNTDCQNPVDIEIDNSNRRLYVTLQSRHVIKYFNILDTDFTLWTSYNLLGVPGTNTTVIGTINLTAFPGTTIAGASRSNQPWGLFLDTADQVLYFTEFGSCKVRALGLPGSPGANVAAQSITAGNSFILNNGAACASEALNTGVSMSANRYNRPYDILVEKSGALVRGFFVTDNVGNRVTYCNNSVSSVTVGDQLISSQFCENVLGNGTNAPTLPVSGRNAAIGSPLGLVMFSDFLYVGDRGNNVIRKFSVGPANTNGSVSVLLGGVGRAGYSGNSPIDSKLVTFNNPLNIMFRGSNKNLYVSDISNFMIRSINLNNGRIEDFAGGVNGNENRLNTTATATNMLSPRGMAMYGEFLMYADTGVNCFIRAHNPYPQDELIFGTLVNSNRTNPVAGYFNNCGDFVGTSPISTASVNAKLSVPFAMGVDASADVMYITSRGSHCILKVTDGGSISPFIGQCGSVAAAPVFGDVYNSSSLKLRSPAGIYMDPAHPGNFFFTDFTDTTLAHIKYANLTVASVTISGTTIAMNNVETVYAGVLSPGYIVSVAAFEDFVCFNSGTTVIGQGNNTVNCYNREDPDTSNSTRFGIPGSGGIQQREEQEGISALSATFAAPTGLDFDEKGNLYISEQGSHVIRMIKKWW